MKDAISRRHALGTLLAVAGLTVTANACGSSTATGAATTGPVTFWTLQDPTNTIQQAQVKSFNSTGHGGGEDGTLPGQQSPFRDRGAASRRPDRDERGAGQDEGSDGGADVSQGYPVGHGTSMARLASAV